MEVTTDMHADGGVQTRTHQDDMRTKLVATGAYNYSAV